eukprot:scaffold119522_cov22-Cyclotella_meneghiniana.AAC.1
MLNPAIVDQMASYGNGKSTAQWTESSSRCWRFASAPYRNGKMLVVREKSSPAAARKLVGNFLIS